MLLRFLFRLSNVFCMGCLEEEVIDFGHRYGYASFPSESPSIALVAGIVGCLFFFGNVLLPHSSAVPTARVLEKPNHQSGFIPRRQDEGVRVAISKHSIITKIEPIALFPLCQSLLFLRSLCASHQVVPYQVSPPKGFLEARRNEARGPNLARSSPEALGRPTSLTPPRLLSGQRTSSMSGLYQKRVVTSPHARMCFVDANPS